MLLQPVYEQDFLDCSHGFRPQRSPHTTLDALWKRIMGLGGCWLIDADIQKFFDTLAKSTLREILNQRVGDGVIRRLVSKWLHAGVLEDGVLMYPEAGTPQGGVISPLLSNIISRKGRDFVRRVTRRERFTRALQNVREYCWKTMAEPVQEQWAGLCVGMKGHYGFYGITGNARALSRYCYMVGRIWWDSLNRRSGHKAKGWEWFNRKILPRYPLPPARVVHSVYA